MDFDHIVLLGYGAPSKADEVMPYLRSMTKGRGIPEERLKALAKHYELIGGGSPYFSQALNFKERLEKEFGAAKVTLPIFLGMKNWHPFFKDVLEGIYQEGFRRGLAIPLTPYRFSSSGAGYRESFGFIRSASEMDDLNYQFIEGWYDQELFIEAAAAEVLRVFQNVPSVERAQTPILFSFHSLPVSQGSEDPMRGYAGEAHEACTLVAERLGHPKWTLVYQSRPLAAKTAWLGPEIEETVKALAAKGEKRILIVPLGFLCDHAEVLYDLDHAARRLIESSGMEYLRAGTVLKNPKIITLFKKLIKASNSSLDSTSSTK